MQYWFYEYCGVGHPIVKEDVKYTAYPRLRVWEMGNMKKTNGQACNLFMLGRHMLTDSQRMGNIDMFGPTALRAGITPMVVTSVSVHSLSQDFSLPGEAEGRDLGWYMEWTERREMLSVAHLRNPPPISSSYDTEELWHLTHGMRRLCLAESARDAQRLQELTDKLATLRSHLDSVDDRLYTHDLHMRKGRDVRVVPLPAGGGAWTRQRGSGPRARGGSTRDNSE
ncbi:hypothetical protein GIB67_027536 [Kingdonia uniflora]|uniref:Uncharacterized protein n=1 Tax=Kingdonia uniflora TaxID=39325 RepID=A0A7J7NLE2_9MAGN|nr:hypothetical protein GIB67_027536 [Kingdonia uniflora]